MLRAGLWHKGQTRLLTWTESPPAGKEFVFTFPQGPEGVFYQILNFLVQVDLSAVVGNRNFTFHLDSGAERYARWGSPNSEVATAQVEFIAYPDATPSILINPTRKGQTMTLPPDLRIPPGHRITSETAALDAGDQYKGLRILVNEWLYEPAGERTSNIGGESDAHRVDTVKLTAAMERIAQLLEAQQATP